jgi:hypothetical protein
MAEITDRLNALSNELNRECADNRRLAKTCHFWLMLLTGVTIAASASAGLLCLGFKVDTRIVGAVALIPGIAASIIQQFKLPAKVDFHYRKWDALKALVRRVDYGLPDNPAAKDIREISDALSALDIQMTAEWQQVVGSDSPERRAPAN